MNSFEPSAQSRGDDAREEHEMLPPAEPESRCVSLTRLADALFMASDAGAVARVAARELEALFGAPFTVLSRDGEPPQIASEWGEAGAPLADRELFAAATTLVRHAHEHARMVERKRAALEAMQYLEQASRLLGESTDRAEVLQALARLALPRLGDYAIIDAVGGDTGETHVGLAHVGQAHVNPEMEALALEYRARYAAGTESDQSPVLRARRSREPAVINSIRPESLAEMAANPDQLRWLRKLHPRSMIVVPLLRFGELLGTMTFCVASTDRQYGTADVALAVAIADRVSSVLHSISLVETSNRARLAAEEANEELLKQASKLSDSNQALQEQAVELEQQMEEAQALSEEVEETLQALAHSEVRFRALVEASAQAVWRSDAHGVIHDSSASWEKLTGIRLPVTGNDPRTRTVHPDDRQRTLDAWQHAVTTGTPYEIEHRLRVTSGEYRWFLARAVPIRDERTQEIQEWVGMHTDIHDRRVAADEQRLLLEVGALLQSESDPNRMVHRALRMLAAYLGLGQCRLSEVDVDAGLITVRGAHVASGTESEGEMPPDYEERLRLSDVTTDVEQGLLGKPFVVTDTMTDPRMAGFHEKLDVYATTRALLSVPLHRGGRWVASLSVAAAEPRAWSEREIALVRRVGDSLWPAYQAARAIAETDSARQEAEQRAIEGEKIARALAATNEELAASEALLAGVVSSAMDAILSVDEAGEISVFNIAAQRIFGVSAEEAVGEPLHRFLETRLDTDSGAHSIRLSADDLTSVPTDRPVELLGRRADGSEFPAEVTISRVAGDTRRFVTVVVRDVTERRALEAQLMQAQKMEAVGQLAGGVAHDFNNILMVIRSYADFLRDSLDPADDRRVDVEEIVTAAGRASALTRQLLAFSRKQVIQPRTLDLNAVVRDIEPMLRRLIGEEIELGVMLHPERVAVRADPGQLEQVIINLAVNARDAMSQGGVLGIETDVATLTSVDIRRYVLDPVIAPQRAWPGDYAVIRVTDTGGGIDDAVLGHIFEPFFTTKGEGRGTGLGLATVHGIVAQAAGHVRVRTSAAEGTSFEILLPRLRREDSGDHLPVGTSHRPHGKGTILLVEDEVTVRRSVKRMLERAGYTVHEARHGADALLVWNEHVGGIDLLLTDLRMPELGGRELIAALHAKDPELAVIAMSGYPPEMGIDPMGTLAGARPVQFLAKPFSSEELLGAVESALRPA